MSACSTVVKLAAVQAAHGAALVEAVEFEERFAVFPRVVVAPSAVQKVRDLAAGSDPLLRSEPERDWLIDNDGTVFLNHLKDVLAFDPNPDLKLRREEVMARYREFVTAGLASSDQRIRSKYVWLATYFNHMEGSK